MDLNGIKMWKHPKKQQDWSWRYGLCCHRCFSCCSSTETQVRLWRHWLRGWPERSELWGEQSWTRKGTYRVSKTCKPSKSGLFVSGFPPRKKGGGVRTWEPACCVLSVGQFPVHWAFGSVRVWIVQSIFLWALVKYSQAQPREHLGETVLGSLHF